jgi:hypothetical protein
MKKSILLLQCFFIVFYVKAQERVITTAVPFLMVTGDARSAGMADIGVATSSDVFSQYLNPAKYPFAEYEEGFSVSYTPYLTNVVNDVSLGQINYFSKINQKSSFSSSLRFFGFGNVELKNIQNEQIGVISPNEFAFDGAYSLKLSDQFSMSVAGRYIRSNLKISTGNVEASAANSFAVGIAGFYQSKEKEYNPYYKGVWRWGFNIQNLGPKMNYENDEFSSNFLPANLKIGGGFSFIFNKGNKLSLNIELNKLLVPTPQNPDLNLDGQVTSEEYSQCNSNYRKIGWVSGFVKSFGDAPNGFKEELNEFTYAFGSEYFYHDSLALRTGYFYESPLKGARQYFTFGLGFKYTAAQIDLSYLFSTSNMRNPLENSLRFSLTFNIAN